ncbi:MAG: VWA domain-containing protein [Fibrobacterales bacterium]
MQLFLKQLAVVFFFIVTMASLSHGQTYETEVRVYSTNGSTYINSNRVSSTIVVEKGVKNQIFVLPSSTYLFDHWESSTGVTFDNAQSDTTSFTPTEDKVTITAVFTRDMCSITFQSATGGHAITADTAVVCGEYLSIDAQADAGYSWEEWDRTSGSGTFSNGSPSSTTTKSTRFRPSAKTVTLRPSFERNKQNFTLTVKYNDEALNDPPNENHTVTEGDSYYVSAPTGKTGYEFLQWIEDPTSTCRISSSSSRSTYVYVNEDCIVRATYQPLLRLYVTADSDGSISTPSSGSIYTSSGDREYITASSRGSNGKIFWEWEVTSGSASIYSIGDNSTTAYIRNTSNATVNAKYVTPLTLIAEASTGGRITTPSSGRDDFVRPNYSEYITATVTDPKYAFSHWTVESGTAIIADTRDNSTSVTLTTNATVKAHFVASKHTLTVYADTATVQFFNEQHTIFSDSTMRFIVPEDIGNYRFSHWTITGSHPQPTISSSTSPSITARLNHNSATLHAVYMPVFDVFIRTEGHGTVNYDTLKRKINGEDFSLSATANTHNEFRTWQSVLDSTYIRYSSYASTSITLRGHDTLIAHIDSLYLLKIDPSLGGHILDYQGYAVDSLRLPASERVVIQVDPDNIYTFDSWDTLQGTPTITPYGTDSYRMSLNSDTHLKPIFIKNKLTYPIMRKDSAYSFTTHGGPTTSMQLDGIFYSLEADGRPINLVFSDTLYSFRKTLSFYGTDSTFTSTAQRVNTVYGDQKEFFNDLDSGVTYYFKVAPSSSSYLTRTFLLHFESGTRLNIISKYGKATPTGYKALFNGDSLEIALTSYRGFEFQEWIIDEGIINYAEGSSTDTAVVITVSGPTARFRADYLLDTRAHPFLTILDEPNIDDHPRICITAQVEDTTFLPSFFYRGLDSANFTVWQQNHDVTTALPNSDALVYPIDVSTELIGSNFMLVMDESRSLDMSGRDTSAFIKASRDAVRDFANNMNYLDKTGVVGFRGGTDTRVHSYMTSNSSAVASAASGLRAIGLTNFIAGLNKGIELIKQEALGSKTIIAFTDGAITDSIYASTLDSALKYDIAIHIIGLEEELHAPWVKAFADSTGGGIYENVYRGDFGALFNTIRSGIKSQYEICYVSPDRVFDYDTNDVQINLNLLGKSSSDTTFWIESDIPPKVELTESTKRLMDSPQSSYSLSIQAYVTDNSAIDNVYLYHRIATPDDRNDYRVVRMSPYRDSTYTASLSSGYVNSPGVEFYIVAQDDSGLKAKAPNKQFPQLEPYFIPVGNQPPLIDFTTQGCFDPGLDSYPFSGRAIDSYGISSVVLYQKFINDPFFEKETLTVVDSSFSGELPIIEDDTLSFYIRARNIYGASSYFPNADGGLQLLPCGPFDAPTATVAPDTTLIDTVLADSLFMDSASVILSSVYDSVAPNARIYYATHDSITLDTTAPYITSGDTLFINKTTHFTMRAYNPIGNKWVGPIGYAGLYVTRRDPLTPPLFVKVDNLEYADFYFADSMRVTVHATDSLTERIIYTYHNGTESIQDTCYSGDTLTIYEQPEIETIFYRTIAWAAFIPDSKATMQQFTIAPKAPAPIMLLKGDTVTGEVAFKDSICVQLTSDIPDAFIHYSYDAINYTEQPILSGDTICITIEATVTAYLQSPRHQPGDKGEWEFFSPPAEEKVSIKGSLTTAKAYIIDGDIDGHADTVSLVFSQPLPALPSSIPTLYWNIVDDTHAITVTPEMIRFAQTNNIEDSSRVIIDLAAIQSSIQGTGLEAGELPYIQLPEDAVFSSEKLHLADMVSPLLLSAVKQPTTSRNGGAYSGEHESNDRITFTFSEPVLTTEEELLDAWLAQFTYLPNCDTTYPYPLPLTALKQIDDEGRIWEGLAHGNTMRVKGCIMVRQDTNVITDSLLIELAHTTIPITGLDKVSSAEVSVDAPIANHSVGHTVTILSEETYNTEIHIFDSYGQFVRAIKSASDSVPLNDPVVIDPTKPKKKIPKRLRWDARDKNNRRVATGVYIWRVMLKYSDGSNENFLIKTGILSE